MMRQLSTSGNRCRRFTSDSPSAAVSGLFVGLVMFLALGAASVRADSPQSEQTPDAETGLVRRGLPTVRGLSISIADGLIRVVKGKRVARIALQWDYLPLDSELLRDFALRQVILSSGTAPATSGKPKSFRLASPEELTLADSQFPSLVPSGPPLNGLVTQTMLDTARKAVFDQLAQKEQLDPQRLTTWHALFGRYWNLPGNAGYEAVAEGLISGRQYYGLLRDHQLIYHILSGNTPRFILHLPKTNDVYLPPRSDSKWKLKTYTFRAGAGTNLVTFDRYSLTLSPTPFDVEVSDAKDNSDVLLRTSAVWESGQGIDIASQVADFKSTTVVAAAPPATSELPASSEEEDTGNWLEAVLKMGGNTTLGDVTGSLFASKNSSVIAGALISEGEVGRVVGLNFEKETSSSARPGVMVGIDVNNSDKLNIFAGPSLSFSAIQLALGARFTTQEQGSGDSSFQIRPAVMLAFDLSRTLGGKEKRTSLEVDSTRASYSWGKSSDDVFARTAGLGTAVIRGEIAPEIRGASVQLRRVEVKNDDVKPSSPPVVINIESGQERILFLPQGQYQWLVRPATATLVLVNEDGTEGLLSLSKLLEVKSGDTPPKSGDTPPRIRVRLR